MTGGRFGLMQQGVDLDFFVDPPEPVKAQNLSHQTRLDASTRPLTAKPSQPVTAFLIESSRPTAPCMKAVIMKSIKPFVFLQQYRVAVCEECGWAVVAEEILTQGVLNFISYHIARLL